MESDRGKEFYNIIFQNFLNNNNFTLFSIKSSLGAVFAERPNRTTRDLLKRPVFEKVDGNWFDVLPTITKQYNIRVHWLTNLTPIQATLKKNESYFYNNIKDKRKIINQKLQVNDLVRTAGLEKNFSKGDTTDWPYKLYQITEINNDSIPSYKVDNFKERYNEDLLKKTELTMKQIDNVMKKLNLNKIEDPLSVWTYLFVNQSICQN